MTAAELTAALKGRWHGSYGSCLCPAHADHTPSLSVRQGDRAPLLHCHTGCEQVAIIDALKSGGLWPGRAERRDYVPPKRKPDDSAARTEAARRIRRCRSTLARSRRASGHRVGPVPILQLQLFRVPLLILEQILS